MDLEPKIDIKFDEASFKRLQRNVKYRMQTQRERIKNPRFALDLPDDIGLQINRRCNLRCTTCFLWNDQGRYIDLPREATEVELDASYLEKILFETREAKSNLFMWGTEPLFHREWPAIAKFLEKDPRWLVMCTNGLLIEKQMETLLPISENLVIDVSVDGFQEAHDKIRGKNTFNRTMKNIKTLLDLQRKGIYKGIVSLHCVLNEGIIPHMYEFAQFAEDLGVDSVYFGIPWYISPKTATEMDQYFKTNLPFLDFSFEGNKPSWHQYTYHIDPAMIPVLRESIAKLNTKVWKVRVRLQPSVKPHEIEDYILGGKMPAQERSQCLGTSTRMDILASGNVTACQSFPEFVVGNVKEQGIKEIWKSEVYGQVREVIAKGLTPICSKCIILYLNGK
jgi:radical SAM protein with 4Fe4S-binding SPASM domain